MGYAKQCSLANRDDAEHCAGDGDESKVAGAAGVAVVPLRSKLTILPLSIDDKSAYEHPSSPKASSEDLARFSGALNGQGNFVSGGMSAMLMDSTRSSKDSNGVSMDILLNLLEQLQGQHFVILAFDCGGLNKNAFVAMAFIQWLCDMGYTTVAMCYFLQLYHSKEMCDR